MTTPIDIWEFKYRRDIVLSEEYVHDTDNGDVWHLCIDPSKDTGELGWGETIKGKCWRCKKELPANIQMMIKLNGWRGLHG